MARLRNFSPEVLQVMADNIDDNTGELWDFFQDAGAWFEGIFTNARQIQEDLDGLNKYLNRYLELEDITHRELLQILDAVKEVEDRYCRKFKDSTEELRDIRLQLKGFQMEMAGIMQTAEVEEDNYLTVLSTLRLLHGADVDTNAILNDPEQLAAARILAHMRGKAFPLNKVQIAETQKQFDIFITGDPLDGVGRFTQGFPRYNSGGEHRGIDIGAPIGTPILLTYPGATVLSVDNIGTATTYGKYAQILVPRIGPNAESMVFTYAHMNSIDVKKGDLISIGGQLGGVGNTGRCVPDTFSHLHIDAAIYDENLSSQLNTPRVSPYPYVSEDFVPDYAKVEGPDGEYLTDEMGNWVIQEWCTQTTI